MTQWGLDVLFNPAKRHMDEEKQRLQSTREEVGDSSGGKRIDLESGRVVIQRQSADEATDAAADEAADDATEADKTDAADEKDAAEPAESSEAVAQSGDENSTE